MNSRHLLCLLFLPLVLRAAEAPPLDLIIMAGQSNAVGFNARPQDLPASAGDAQIPFWWRCGDPGPDDHDTTSGGAWSTLRAQPLGNPSHDGPRQYGNFAQAEGGFGPEIGLARTLQAQGQSVAVVKVAFSGTGLRSDWNSADAGVGGACYRALLGEMTAALAAAREQHLRLRLRAFAWVQGESDANAQDAPKYTANFLALLAALRHDLHAPDLIALLAVNEHFGSAKGNAFMPQIVAAQQAVAAADVRCVRVPTDAFSIANDAHFDSVGTLAVGEAMAAALVKKETELTGQVGGALFNTEPSPTLPLPPAEAVQQWRFPDGLAASVFAAEPDVRQPIALAVDDRGRLWVAECYTYAEAKTGWVGQLKDRIVIFEDTDGDGHHDKRTVFCEGLDKLTSIEIGFGGVWALALPNLIFIPDANGDDRPDGPPLVKLDGFEWKAGHHTVANGLRWGPDGWLYGRHGIQSVSTLGAPGTPDDQRLKMNVGIWRYHPQRGTCEVVCVGTTNPWGMDWNEYGEAFFINTVIGHLWQVIPGAHYRRMYGNDLNAHTYEVMEQHADHVHWASGEKWNDWQHLGTTDATSAAGGGHAHTGLLFYNGDNWPDAWRGKLLTINFNGRRLNVEDVVPEGSGYVGKRLPDIGQASDPWFRGIDLVGAADGGVFLADWSDTGECHENDGVNRMSGRLYKIALGKPQSAAVADVGKLSAAELLPLLDHKNEFYARHARRRLQEMSLNGTDLKAVRDRLRQKFADDPNVVGKLRALWCLYASGGTDAEFLRAQLLHAEAHVRQWAIRLLVDIPTDDATHTALISLAAKETSAPVRLSLVSALQRLPVAARITMAKPLLSHSEDAADHNFPQMLWYGIEGIAEKNPAALAELAQHAAVPHVRRCIARRLTEANSLAPLLSFAIAASAAVQADVLQGMAVALQGQRQAKPPEGWTAAAAVFAESKDAAVQEAFRVLGAIFADPLALAAMQKIVLDPQADAEARRAALRALIAARAPGLRALCEQVLPTPALLATAAGGLALEADPALVELILKEYPHAAANDRSGILSTLISRASWAARVLTAVADGRIPRADLSAFHARQIRSYNAAALTAQVATVWGEVHDSSAEKQARMAQWKTRLTPAVLEQADRAKGRTLFQAVCATCHTLNGEGGKIGPELTGSSRDNLDYLLSNIGDPSAVVARDYQLTTLTMKDARVLAGFIREKNDHTVTLQTLAEAITVPASDIAKTEVAPISLMPEGLLEALSETDVRDLMGYLMAK